MKVEKLFKKVEEFFGMNKKKQKTKNNKKEKLKDSLNDKISSLKKKIKNTNNKQKKYKLKEELIVLIKINKKLK